MAQSTEGRARIAYRGSSAGLDQPVTQNARALQTRQEELKAQREAMQRQAEQQRKADRQKMLSGLVLDAEMSPFAADVIMNQVQQVYDEAGELSDTELQEEVNMIKSNMKKYENFHKLKKENYKDADWQNSYVLDKKEDGNIVVRDGTDANEAFNESLTGEHTTITDDRDHNDDQVYMSYQLADKVRGGLRNDEPIDMNSVMTTFKTLSEANLEERYSGGYYDENTGKAIVETTSQIDGDTKKRIKQAVYSEHKDAIDKIVVSEYGEEGVPEGELKSAVSNYLDGLFEYKKVETDVMSGGGAREEKSEYDITPVPLGDERKSKMRQTITNSYSSSLSGVDDLSELFNSGEIDEIKKNDKEFYDILSNASEVEKQVEDADTFADFPYEGKLDIEGDDYNVQNLIHDSFTGDSYVVAYSPQEVRVSDYEYMTVKEKTGEKDDEGKDIAKEKLQRKGTTSSKANVRNYKLIKLTPSVNQQLRNISGKDKVDYLNMFGVENESINLKFD